MREDFSDFHEQFVDRAKFLPSIHSTFVKSLSKTVDEIRPGFSPTVLHTMDKLNFLDQRNGFFYYPWALYSAGHAELDLVKAKDPNDTKYEGMIYNRVRKRDGGNTFLMVDSGGYQVVTGALKINNKPFDWDNPDEGRMQMLRWQEAVGDVATILDVPTLAIKSSDRFNTFQDCLDQTNENLRFIDQHRTGEVPFINVLQGDNNDEIEDWYDGVKWFDANGWAFAGGTKYNLYNLLRTIILLRDDGALEGKKVEYLHLLGVGRPIVAAAMTLIQQNINEHINPNAMVTLDAANASIMASLTGRINLHYTTDERRGTSPVNERFESILAHCDPNKRFPDAWGPVLKQSNLPTRDIFVQNPDGTWRFKQAGQKGGPSDMITHSTMVAHNTYMLLDEILANNFIFSDANLEENVALEAVRNGLGAETALVDNFRKIKRTINTIFSAKDPGKHLDRHRNFLTEFVIWNPR